MNVNLFKSILAMDSYNRGYNASIVFGSNPGSNFYSVDVTGIQIGTATIYDSAGDAAAQSIGFYAISYQLSSGEKVISYRGTDNPLGSLLYGGDIWNGWLIGGGFSAQAQAKLATYDSNADGKITSLDTQFANLRVWVDAVNDNEKVWELFPARSCDERWAA